MFWTLDTDKLICSLLRGLIDIFVFVQAGFGHEESKDSLMILLLNKSGSKFENLRDCDSIYTIITDQAHLHFLILSVVVLDGLETHFLNDFPFFIIELDQVINELG